MPHSDALAMPASTPTGRRSMASFEMEKSLVGHLLERLSLNGASMSNPNTYNLETGMDVLIHAADSRTIGVQVTEIDPYTQAGIARAEEKKAAGTDNGKIYSGWAQNDYQVMLSSLSRNISRKVAIAVGHSFESVDEVWLLVCAGVPQHGAVISTMVITQWLSAADLNQATHAVLQQSKYDRSFFLTVLGTEQVFYSWEKDCGWKKSAKLEEITEAPHEKYVNSLHRAAAAGDLQEVDRLCDEECKKVLNEMRKSQDQGDFL